MCPRNLYHEEYVPSPVVCFDETSKQLLGDVLPLIRCRVSCRR